jgi:hypothetical protein
LDHFDKYGDVYATLDTCDELESLLNRLRRGGLYGDAEWMGGRRHLAEIRAGLARLLDS